MEEIFSSLTLWQAIGTVFGLTQVLLARKNNINTYLFGIASILISIWVRFRSKLYGDILLDAYYLIMSIYGWYYWKFGKKNKQTPISYATKKEQFNAIKIVLIGFVLIAFWLFNYTDSNVPIWDAVTSAFAFAGMWLMAKRKMENWIYLNISNFIAIPLLIYKELYIYAGLTVFLFIVAISGYLEWKKIIENEKRINAETTE